VKLKTIRLIADLADDREDRDMQIRALDKRVLELLRKVECKDAEISVLKSSLSETSKRASRNDALTDKYDALTLKLFELIGALVKEHKTGKGTKDRRAWMKALIEQLIQIRGANETEQVHWYVDEVGEGE
jgi:predicted RNase H-like nuclease (RuvC/YqgF family)